jgi:hypothetical protein
MIIKQKPEKPLLRDGRLLGSLYVKWHVSVFKSPLLRHRHTTRHSHCCGYHLSEGKNHRPGGLKNQVRFFPRNSVFNCFSVSEASGVFAFVLVEILKGLMVWVWAFTGSLLTRKSRQP